MSDILSTNLLSCNKTVWKCVTLLIKNEQKIVPNGSTYFSDAALKGLYLLLSQITYSNVIVTQLLTVYLL